MNRVRKHISFVIWFVGLSYLALWPTTIADGMTALFAATPDAPVVAPSVAVPPGLRLLGALAAYCVALQFAFMLMRRLLRMACRRFGVRLHVPLQWRNALHGRLAKLRSMTRSMTKSAPVPSLERRRTVAPRREFGLRAGPDRRRG